MVCALHFTAFIWMGGCLPVASATKRPTWRLQSDSPCQDPPDCREMETRGVGGPLGQRSDVMNWSARLLRGGLDSEEGERPDLLPPRRKRREEHHLRQFQMYGPQLGLRQGMESLPRDGLDQGN